MSALTKFLAKGADFLPPRAAALVEERIAALRAVREKVAGKANKIGGGYSADVYSVGDKLEKAGDTVVKSPHNYGSYGTEAIASNKRNLKEFKRRGFLESILADKKLAPRTMLVETSKNKYMVQPKWDDTDGLDDIANFAAYPDLGKWAKRNTKKIGMTSEDLSSSNIGFFGGKPGIIDAGHEKLTRAMTPAERRSALEKFISKGKRKKPWLEE